MADLELPVGRALHDVDEHLWIAGQIAALRDGDFERIDHEQLAAYLTETTIRDRRELASRLKLLLQHILKCQHQPERLTSSWRLTILEQQDEIRGLVEDIPSLGAQGDELLRKAYPKAVKAASIETGLAISRFPADTRMTLGYVLLFDVAG